MAKYDIPALTAWAIKSTAAFWQYAEKKMAAEGYNIGKMPAVVMNSRLTSTAGRAWCPEGKIDLSCYLMTRNYETFHTDTIPHELCHIIAYRLFKSGGHDKAWYYVIDFLKVNTKRCHNMTPKSRAR